MTNTMSRIVRKTKINGRILLGLLVVVSTIGWINTVTALPTVLIIGDSISIGYMEPLKEMFKGIALLEHHPGNAQHSGYGLEHLDQWLGETRWDVIHFNHGLHDLKYVDDEGKNVASKEEGHIQVSLDQYAKNMEEIVIRLKETDAVLIFATTTPYPAQTDGPLREMEDAAKYNTVALEIMASHGIAVNDLYSFARPQLDKIQRPNNVHFTPEGSHVLAGEVARHIRIALGN